VGHEWKSAGVRVRKGREGEREREIREENGKREKCH
tara:strand:- start:300 stop:407 length:108 start_codon:yes stop_codon:yes gene_type:complete